MVLTMTIILEFSETGIAISLQPRDELITGSQKLTK